MTSLHVAGASATDAGLGRPNQGASLKHVLFLVNVDWFFLSHRLPIAVAAREAGFRVTVAAEDTGKRGEIEAAGLSFVPMPFSRMGVHPLREAIALAAVVRLYRRLRPDLVHQVTVKPVLYGSIAARLTGVPAVVNAISGLGYLFTAQDRARILRRMVQAGYRYALRSPNVRTIFQNEDDRRAFVDGGVLAPEAAVLIRGSGVDCTRFRPGAREPGEPIVMLPARLLWDKGVGAFVEAARLLRARGSTARFVLVGDTDPHNPAGIPRPSIDAWVAEGVVESWGHRGDMPEVLRRAAIVVLPSHREGLPKALLEAGASGKPLVATDVPGCREVVRPGVNGLLVPVEDPAALAEALERLLADTELRDRMGAAARKIAVTEFREEIVVASTLELYRDLLARYAGVGPAAPGSP